MTVKRTRKKRKPFDPKTAYTIIPASLVRMKKQPRWWGQGDSIDNEYKTLTEGSLKNTLSRLHTFTQSSAGGNDIHVGCKWAIVHTARLGKRQLRWLESNAYAKMSPEEKNAADNAKRAARLAEQEAQLLADAAERAKWRLVALPSKEVPADAPRYWVRDEWEAGHYIAQFISGRRDVTALHFQHDEVVNSTYWAVVKLPAINPEVTND